jgi:hypothetical protein
MYSACGWRNADLVPVAAQGAATYPEVQPPRNDWDCERNGLQPLYDACRRQRRSVRTQTDSDSARHPQSRDERTRPRSRRRRLRYTQAAARCPVVTARHRLAASYASPCAQPARSNHAERSTQLEAAMLYPTVKELTRGTAHPEIQRPQTVLVALSPELEPSVANTNVTERRVARRVPLAA